MTRWRGALCATVATLTMLLVACGTDAPGALSAPAFPVGAPRTLASATLYTSPDGGIYKNPDPLSVIMVTRLPATAVMHELGASAAAWTALTRFGDFTYVGVTVHNHGAAGSDPQLNAVQIASDFAPDGTGGGALRHFYHPMFPLALLSDQRSDSSCSIHLDPGHDAVVVLLYPPIRPTPSIVWGVYQDFAVRAALGGALPPGPHAWHISACTPPQPVAPAA